ncbi:UNVERIFIED_CONTAM: hypothetical protein Sradi_6935800 [Sesamum radiatum]|uniref:Secreted protein n=1 Tax=Sesamum radiatum TaxID=300843 RepID=A0AAW2JGV7_SESRA
MKNISLVLLKYLRMFLTALQCASRRMLISARYAQSVATSGLVHGQHTECYGARHRGSRHPFKFLISLRNCFLDNLIHASWEGLLVLSVPS